MQYRSRRAGVRAYSRWTAAVAAVALMVTGGCGSSKPAPHAQHSAAAPVVVASFNFPESELLAEIYGGALAARGIPVRMELGLGTREMVLPAFQEGLVDVVPEYIGSGLEALGDGAAVTMSEPAVVEARLAEAVERWGGQVLSPSPAQDQNGVVVTRLTAARYGLRTVGDLARVANSMTFTAPPECPERPYCLVGLERVYGVRFRGFLPLASETERVTALQENVADAALLFTTSPLLADPSLVVLEDDRRLQPAENVAPLVSDRAIARYGPGVSEALDTVSARLSSEELVFLNWRMSVAGRSPQAEAHGWLVRQGLIPHS